MSRRVLQLPIRSARAAGQPWVCKRCLATQAEPTSTSTIPSMPAILDPRRTYGPPPTASESPSDKTYDPALKYADRIGPDGVPQILTPSERAFKKGLGHRIPLQYLQHSTSHLLPELEKEQRSKVEGHREIVGVVVSAGKMDKTVKVRVPKQVWNRRIRKHFADHTDHLVHDPNTSLLEGDVVSLHRLHASKAVHHVVASIISPFGKPIDQRPPIPSPDDRLAEYKEKRVAKLERRTLRRQAAMGDERAINRLRGLGLDPGDGVAPGIGEAGNVQKKVGISRDGGKGAILGAKGQKLPKGVIPGGKHAVGKIDERAKHNKEQAMKRNEKAEANLLEAKDM